MRATLAIVWRIAAPYFRSEDKWAGFTLLGAVVAIELSLVAIDVLVNQWNNRFYNALQDRNWATFVYETGFFCVLGASNVLLAVYQLYLNQWLHEANHYRMQLQGDAADNPDQRIADDIRMFVSSTIGIGLNLLNSIVTLLSFVVIL